MKQAIVLDAGRRRYTSVSNPPSFRTLAARAASVGRS
jgi:hypothetical protein